MTSTAQSDGNSDAAEKTRLLLANLWQRNRPVIEERLAVLDRAAAADPVLEEMRTAALEVSHKLSGSLGMFGFEQGTLLARELEALLDTPCPEALRLAELTRQLRAVILPPL